MKHEIKQFPVVQYIQHVSDLICQLNSQLIYVMVTFFIWIYLDYLQFHY